MAATNVIRHADYSKSFHRVSHVTALNRSGKIESVIDALIPRVFYLHKQASVMNSRDMVAAIRESFGVTLSSSIVESSMERLLNNNSLRRDSSGHYSLSRNVRRDIESSVSEANELARQAQTDWRAALSASHPNLHSGHYDQLWNALIQYLKDVFYQHGVRSVRLLDPSLSAEEPQAEQLTVMRSAAIHEYCKGIDPNEARTAIDSFFSSPTQAQTAYLSQFADGTFTLFALTVDSATTKFLLGELEPIDIFVDTNFIFGVEGIHSDPNRLEPASVELMEFLRDYGDQLKIRLCCHEETLKQYRYEVDEQIDELEDTRWEPNAIEWVGQLPTVGGVQKRFLQLKAQHPDLTLAEFRRRFDMAEFTLDNLGISVSQTESPDIEANRQISDLVEKYDSYMRRVRPSKPKPKLSLMHDVIVWQHVESLRNQNGLPRGNSLFDARAFFLTTDEWFSKFVRSLKRRGAMDAVILPTTLLQILRPFAVSDQEMDKRFAEALTLPELQSISYENVLPSRERVLEEIRKINDLYGKANPKVLARAAGAELFALSLNKSSESEVSTRAAAAEVLAEDNRLVHEENEKIHRELDQLKIVLKEQTEQISKMAQTQTEESDKIRKELESYRGRERYEKRVRRSNNTALKPKPLASPETVDMTSEPGAVHSNLTRSDHLPPLEVVSLDRSPRYWAMIAASLIPGWLVCWFVSPILVEPGKFTRGEVTAYLSWVWLIVVGILYLTNKEIRLQVFLVVLSAIIPVLIPMLL